MRLLVLGGGGFLGFHVVDAAVAAGHSVTVLSRSGSAQVSGVEVLTADRRGDVDVLRGRQWDGVVDTFTDDRPGAPAVARTAALLSGAVATYCYVSGMSVYAPDGSAVPDESAPVRRAGGEPDDDPLQARSMAKLAAERVVAERFDGAVLVPRVGIMVGPRDPSQRFTWWPVRFLRALTGAAAPVVLGPGAPGRAVQYSDARDIARWLVEMTAAGQGGTFNAVGPLRPDSLGEVLGACLDAARDRLTERRDVADVPDVTVRWRPDEAHLREALVGIGEEDRPLWYPEDQIPQNAIDSSAAASAGLTFRSAGETAAQTLAWAVRHDPEPLSGFAEPS